MSQPIPVALARAPGYDDPELPRIVDRLLGAIGYAPRPGDRVLVKPNLIAARRHGLACTHPAVTAAVCAWLLDHQARVTVADSPAFGRASMVAARSGLVQALKPLNIKVRSLERPRALPLTLGGTIGVSALALDADAILNLPKLKAHGQMRLSLAVKNCFGCVVGSRKAVAHARFGERDNRFESMILDILLALPPTPSLLDGVTAMSRTGPIDGLPCGLELLAASPDPAALDTALCGMLGASPDIVPIWAEVQARDLPGGQPENLVFPLERPEAFDCSAFQLPERLRPVSFRPLGLLRSLILRGLARFR